MQNRPDYRDTFCSWQQKFRGLSDNDNLQRKKNICSLFRADQGDIFYNYTSQFYTCLFIILQKNYKSNSRTNSLKTFATKIKTRHTFNICQISFDRYHLGSRRSIKVVRKLDFVDQEIYVKANYLAIATSSSGDLFTIASNVYKAGANSLIKVRVSRTRWHGNFICIVREFSISIGIKGNIISSKFPLRTAAVNYLNNFFEVKKNHWQS